MQTVQGVVVAKRKDGKGIRIGETWYSVFLATELDSAVRNATVSFAYEENVRGHQTYRNIKGPITVVSTPEQETVTKPEGASIGGERDKVLVGTFINLHKDRSIARQNSLTNARELFIATGHTPDLPLEESAEKIIGIAKLFEGYTTGDFDVAELTRNIDSMEDV